MQQAKKTFAKTVAVCKINIIQQQSHQYFQPKVISVTSQHFKNVCFTCNRSESKITKHQHKVDKIERQKLAIHMLLLPFASASQCRTKFTQRYRENSVNNAFPQVQSIVHFCMAIQDAHGENSKLISNFNFFSGVK